MKHDAIILGGGPNGLATALALGGHTLPSPLRVLVLDRSNPNAPSTDSRGTALTLATQSMLQKLGVWHSLSAHACEMRDVTVTDSDGELSARASRLSLETEASSASAASMVENRHLHRSLLQAVNASRHITIVDAFEFHDCNTTPAGITVFDRTSRSFKATLLVAADGKASPMREHLGIAVVRHDYDQTALSFAISLTLPHFNMAQEHFSPTGVFAFLPLRGLAASVVWGMSHADAQTLMGLDDEAFNVRLQAVMGHQFGTVALSGRRQAFPLVMQIAKEFRGPRVALLGDAAHAIHPLAGLGLNLGFKDAAVLADCVFSTVFQGGDLGGSAMLDRYQTLRRFETLQTSWAMDGLNAMFANTDPTLRVLRGLGLRVIDQLEAAKSMIMQQATGLSQNNPRLMRGLWPG